MAIDYNTTVGQVRLLIADTTESSFILSDAQIEAFIAMVKNNSIFRAAAAALDSIADSEALVSKVIRTQDLSTNGAAVADSLRKHADSLRKRADEDDEEDDDTSFFFDIAPFHNYGPELTESEQG